MARAGLLLFLLAAACEDCSVESFSLAPGDLQGAPSRGVWHNAKPSSSIFARNSFAQSPVTHDDGCAGGAGAVERRSSGCLSAAASTAAATESSEYLENKEALKKVGLVPPMIRKRRCCETAESQRTSYQYKTALNAYANSQQQQQ